MENLRQLFRDALLFDIAYSSRKIHRTIFNIEDSIKDTNQRLDKLKEAINNHLTNINTYLLLQSNILSNIIYVLKNKRKTEAEELKSFGIFAFKNDWYDEAEEDFLESLQLNKYDYQVYFLLSKIFCNKNDEEKQIEYLNRSLKYSVDDVDFQQFVYMDMIVICISNNDFETAKLLLQQSLALKKSTAVCLTSAIIDIKRNIISDNTFKNIEEAIDYYQSESPARIIEAIDALSTFVNSEHSQKIKNIINKSKLKVLKQYSSISFQKINNLEDLLNQISKDKNFIVNIVPSELIKKHNPNFVEIPNIIAKLDELQSILKNSSIESYEYLIQLPIFFSYLTDELIRYYRLVLDFQTEGNILTNPFSKKFDPEGKILNLDNSDLILIQSKLDSGSFITLTCQKLIITKPNGLSKIFQIEDIDKLELEIINTKEDIGKRSKDGSIACFDIITFLLKKKDTDQILLIDKSSYFTWDYGSNQKKANMLNLLWALAQNNSRIVRSMIGINSILNFMKTITDNYLTALHSNQLTNKSSDTDVEFVE